MVKGWGTWEELQEMEGKQSLLLGKMVEGIVNTSESTEMFQSVPQKIWGTL